MRKKLCNVGICMLAILLFLLSCRNEDLSNGAADSKREEAFFREAMSKTARLKNGNSIVEALKKQNEKSHFVSKMIDKRGLPIWDKMLTFKRPNTTNKGESGDGSEEYVIPLTENEKNLSSILYVTKYADSSFAFKNVDNEKLKRDVYNPEIDKDDREQMLLNFIAVDNLSFSKDAVYWNIPDDLLTSIPQSTIYPQRRFTATVSTSENGGDTSNFTNVLVCIIFEIECTVCDENAGHTTYSTKCYIASGTNGGGGDGGDGGGNPGGNPNPGGNNGGDTGGGGGGLPTGDPESNDDCSSPNKAFYKVVPGCDDDGGDLPIQVQTLKNKLLSINSNNDISEYTYFLSSYPNTAQVFANYLNQNYNQKGADIIMAAIKFWFTYPDTVNVNQLPNRISDLNNALVQNPDLLLDIPCSELPKWKDVATHQVPQSVKTKIENIKNQTDYYNNWEITDLENGLGTRLNMDLFPVKITTMPNKPKSTRKYTSAEFFDFFRKNINLFAETFTPIEDDDYNIHDTALWNSSNPLGALIHIDITPDDGTVICSGFSTNAWIFTTIKAPLSWGYDGVHPVAGNRLFSYYTNSDGSINIYTRGVDRVSHNYSNTANVLNYILESLAFEGADNLWSDMQDKLSAYVQSHGGVASTVKPEKYRPDYNKIKDYIKGNAPLNSLGCH